MQNSYDKLFYLLCHSYNLGLFMDEKQIADLYYNLKIIKLNIVIRFYKTDMSKIEENP